MRMKLCEALVDPSQRDKMNVEIHKELDGHVVEGNLVASNGVKFPIRCGVPRFVETDGDSEDCVKQTGGSFGDKWIRYRGQSPEEIEKQLGFLKEQFLCMLDCTDDNALNERFRNAENVLNAGCSIAWSEYGFNVNTRANRWAIDVSGSVDVAFERTRNIDNIAVLQADLFALPFQNEFFDIIFSNGVVHHTPDPRCAVLSLCNHLKKGGFLALYIYNKKPFIRENADAAIRAMTTKMTSDECMEFSRQMAHLGKALHKVGAHIHIDEDIPLLGIKKDSYELQKFIYDHFVKCFYNPNISFDRCCLNNLDWYHPAIASHHSWEEIQSWLVDGGISKPTCRQPRGWEHSGFFVSGIKDAGTL